MKGFAFGVLFFFGMMTTLDWGSNLWIKLAGIAAFVACFYLLEIKE